MMQFGGGGGKNCICALIIYERYSKKRKSAAVFHNYIATSKMFENLYIRAFQYHGLPFTF
jgi:hypothetical protein